MPKQTVKLVSAEGFEFIVDYKAACVSNTIRNMLSSQGEDASRHREQLLRRVAKAPYNTALPQPQIDHIFHLPPHLDVATGASFWLTACAGARLPR
jgi:hypothetical protein